MNQLNSERELILRLVPERNDGDELRIEAGPAGAVLVVQGAGSGSIALTRDELDWVCQQTAWLVEWMDEQSRTNEVAS